jgi:hypothetical protein
VEEGESLLDFERRVFGAWLSDDKFLGRNDGGGLSPFASGRAPYLNRETGELSTGLGKKYWVEHCGGFDGCWKTLPGARKQIDLATLSRLRTIKKTEASKPELKPTPPPTLPAPIPRQQPDAIRLMYVPPDAHRGRLDSRS